MAARLWLNGLDGLTLPRASQSSWLYLGMR